MGNSNDKLQTAAKTIMNPIIHHMPDKNLQLIILQYLGNGVVAWISIHFILKSSKSSKSSKFNDSSNSYHETINYFGNNVLKALEEKIKHHLTQEKKNNSLYKLLLLESIIGAYGDIDTYEWFRNVNPWPKEKWNYITYGHYAFFCAAEYNQLDMCKYMINKSYPHIDLLSKEWALYFFVKNGNLEAALWLRNIIMIKSQNSLTNYEFAKLCNKIFFEVCNRIMADEKYKIIDGKNKVPDEKVKIVGEKIKIIDEKKIRDIAGEKNETSAKNIWLANLKSNPAFMECLNWKKKLEEYIKYIDREGAKPRSMLQMLEVDKLFS